MHGTAALLNFWSNTWIKHTTGKNKPSLVSAPIFRVTDQSTTKCHHFENCNFYKDLYGERARLICHTKPYNNRNFQIDGASRYFGVWLTIGPLTNFGLLFPVVCIVFVSSFIGAVLSMIKTYKKGPKTEFPGARRSARFLFSDWPRSCAVNWERFLRSAVNHRRKSPVTPARALWFQ